MLYLPSVYGCCSDVYSCLNGEKPMQTINIENKLDDFERRIRREFPDVLMEFSSRAFSTHAEIWVYVMSLEKYDDVQGFCKNLIPEAESYDLPIWIFTKTWTGPWPGGESEDQIRRRRNEFLRQHHLQLSRNSS